MKSKRFQWTFNIYNYKFYNKLDNFIIESFLHVLKIKNKKCYLYRHIFFVPPVLKIYKFTLKLL